MSNKKRTTGSKPIEGTIDGTIDGTQEKNGEPIKSIVDQANPSKKDLMNSSEIMNKNSQKVLANPVLTFYEFPVSQNAQNIAKTYRYKPYMIERYFRMFGERETIQLLDSFDSIEPIYIRINSLKSKDENVLSQMQSKGYKFQPVLDIEHLYRLDLDYRDLLERLKNEKELKKAEKKKSSEIELSKETSSRIILPELKEEIIEPDFTRDKSQLESLEWGKIPKSKSEDPKQAIENKLAFSEKGDEKRKMRSLYGHQVATLGSTNEYLWGQYYIQDFASSLPVIYLNPQPTDFVIDMCAAPGSKTTQLAQFMQNKGRIVAIEISEDRVKSLVYNLRRCGVQNTTVLNMDASKILDLNLHPDKILLDAPCSGEGIIRDDPSRKQSRNPSDIVALMKKQSSLLSTALKAVKPGGFVMYSTCSIAPEENEFIIQNALETYKKAEVVPMNDTQGMPGYVDVFGVKLNQELLNSRRYYPHIHNSSGFFLSLLHKKV